MNTPTPEQIEIALNNLRAALRTGETTLDVARERNEPTQGAWALVLRDIERALAALSPDAPPREG